MRAATKTANSLTMVPNRWVVGKLVEVRAIVTLTLGSES